MTIDPSDYPPPSKFTPAKETKTPITIEDIKNLNNKFWEQESVELHKCYKIGNVFANNSNKKTSIDLLQDMFVLLGDKYKDSDKHAGTIALLISNINDNLEIIENLGEEVDKNCILSIIQGYTLGCLNIYEKSK